MIREELRDLVERALAAAQEAGELPAFAAPEVQLEHPQRPEHGDYAANLPLRIQGLAKMKALDVAEVLRARVPSHPAVGDVQVAPPGFLNLYLDPGWAAEQARAIAEAGEAWPALDLGGGRKTQVEYVSANPTGPVHVGNGRGAAIGSTLANVLRATGHEVEEGVLHQRRGPAGRDLRAHALRSLPATARPRRRDPPRTATPASTSSRSRARSRPSTATPSGDPRARSPTSAWAPKACV